MRLTAEDHAKVSAAVTAAERSSDGEIVTIVAARSDAYSDVAFLYPALAMLVPPLAFAALPMAAIDAVLSPFAGWNSQVGHGIALLALVGMQLLAFLLARLVLGSQSIRLALTRPSTKSRRVHARALELFRASAERRTIGRTGVLLYLSLAEHRAEIMADEAIHSQVTPEVWGAAMAALIGEVKEGRPGDGMALAVEQIGHVLAEYLPKTGTDTNELPDKLIEL